MTVAATATVIIGPYELATRSDSSLLYSLQLPTWVAWTGLVVLGAVGVMSGILVVAIGEAIGVLFAIEINTRRSTGRVSESPSGDIAR